MAFEAKVFSASDVAAHNTKKDMWMTIHGKVYDVSKYLDEHPGGADALVDVAGKDATSAFEDLGHSEDAREQLVQYLVGDAEGGDISAGGGGTKPTVVSRIAKPVKKQQKLWPTAVAVDLLIAGVVVFAGYEIFARIPKLGWLHHSDGGFWRGFVISGTAFMGLATALAIQLEKKLDITKNKEFSSRISFNDPPARHSHAAGWLKPLEYQKLPLIRKDLVSADSHRLLFKLPNPQMVIGLPIGQHVAIRGIVDGEIVSRSYTPVSNNSDPGVLELVIKMYGTGKLTGGYLANLKVGDEVDFRGPKGAMRYRKGMAKSIGMIAGGTGITPMYQLIRAIVEDPTDNTQVNLLYGSQTEPDILLRAELEEFERKGNGKFKCHYILSNPDAKWTGLKGRINKELIREKFAQPSGDAKVMLCGPPGMVDACKASLVELGFEKPASTVSVRTDQIFMF